ncbi:type II toxin-antitoxin system HicA family toxin [Desertihabitans brevis]|uniref:Type II toxin-antitoxin system HicA family toxin n=1 Tax=Desertihabitans brevis TaxID=2268447 RepID=A0A367YR59_9ACTN|nr:type II toxin-antitoxin system HicA family toxin [Desertihabitans brevis]RCK68280.1 type II toxin-antitoxin system HicA family toxin [Desertihabitans brevis]
MKRRDLMKQIAKHAKANGLDVTTREGGSHTVVTVGENSTTVPRHNEINEMTAKAILKQIGATK